MQVKELIKKIIPSSVLDFYHFLLPMLGAFLYRFPSRKLIVIGVTGTNGKSTVVDLAVKILEEANFKVASVSSIKFKIKEKEWQNPLKMTMPGRLKLQRFLRRAKNAGCQYAVLEVTSEGIKQHRHQFIDFDCAVFTNLTPEHIDSHGSFEKYKEAKSKLFQSLANSKSKILNSKQIQNSKFKIQIKKISIVNLDDKNAEYFLQFPADEKIGFSLLENSGGQASTILKVVSAQSCQILPNGLKFSVDNIEFDLNLLGKFNIYNALAAVCVGLSQGVGLEICKMALEKIRGIPGRMEVVMKEPFTIIVDYAHTPDALEKVYESVGNSKFQKSKLICALGAAGGGRDKWKRPEMGKIAARYCDEIILTNEDPYDENPEKILDEIFSGFSSANSEQRTANICKILDRREAIRKALSSAKPGDTVIITGKGSEPWMCVARNKKIPWDERKIIKEEMKKLSK